MDYSEIIDQGYQFSLQTTPTAVTEASSDEYGLLFSLSTIALTAGATYLLLEKRNREEGGEDIPALGAEELKGLEDEDDFQNLLEERNT